MWIIVLLACDAVTHHHSTFRSHGSPKTKITGTTPPVTCDTYDLDDNSLVRQFNSIKTL